MRTLKAKRDSEARGGGLHIPLRLDLINPLYPIVSVDNYEKIKVSIEAEGMDWPIILWETTYTEWNNLYKAQPDDILEPNSSHSLEETCFLLMCGNNRYRVARELEYDKIDCILCVDRMDINTLAKLMREDWRNK